MSTALTVSSKVVASASIPRVALRPVLGAYELVFEIQAVPTPLLGDRTWWIRPQSLRVSVVGPPQYDVGTARPEWPEIVHQSPGAHSRQLWMTLPIHPHQLSALEDRRDGGDLVFGLTVHGDGGDGAVVHEGFRADARLAVPQSEWIGLLKTAGAMDILLLEIPTSMGSPTNKQSEAIKQLQKAQSHFVAGSYNDTISACRVALEEMGVRSAPLNLLNGPTRGTIGKTDRRQAMLASLLHYAHPPHHGGSEVYSRDEARMTLHMTAAAIASGPF